MPQTKTKNDVLNVKVLPLQESHLSQGGVVRSDKLPPMPTNVYFGQMQILAKPEPITKKANS